MEIPQDVPQVPQDEHQAAGDVPLCVDLDGTVVYGDMSLRSLTAYLRKNPLGIIMAGIWHLRGRAFVKYMLSRRYTFAPSALPYIPETLEFLRQEKARGRKIYLCTGSCTPVAMKISRHLGLFDGIMGTKIRKNFIGEIKCRELVRRFGEEGFDYAGNSRQDLKVWRHSRRIIIVNASPSTEAAARREFAGREIIRLTGTEKILK